MIASKSPYMLLAHGQNITVQACLPARAAERSEYQFKQGSLQDLQFIRSCLWREK
jgi:hypothetical protein